MTKPTPTPAPPVHPDEVEALIEFSHAPGADALVLKYRIGLASVAKMLRGERHISPRLLGVLWFGVVLDHHPRAIVQPPGNDEIFPDKYVVCSHNPFHHRADEGAYAAIYPGMGETHVAAVIRAATSILCERPLRDRLLEEAVCHFGVRTNVGWVTACGKSVASRGEKLSTRLSKEVADVTCMACQTELAGPGWPRRFTAGKTEGD